MKRRQPRYAKLLLLHGTILLCTTSSVFGASLSSSWNAEPADGASNVSQSWREARDAVRLDNGRLFARNDSERLYLLIDLTGDTIEDSP